jgi:hypothetical protein
MFKLWNQVAPHEWQAGGSARYYSIMQEGERFAVSLCSYERRLKVVAVASNLLAAKDAALIDWARYSIPLGKPEKIAT